jgi:hypothetical protein
MKKNFLIPMMILSTLSNTVLAQEIVQNQTETTVNPAETTGPAIEGSQGPGTDEVDAQKIYFIKPRSVNVRQAPSAKAASMGVLWMNDKVRIVDSATVYEGGFVQIEIVSTTSKITPSEKYFVSKEYLSEKIIDYREFEGKLFAVVNVATETVRVYERQCADNSCAHKMVMEAEVVVGEDIELSKTEKGKGRSILGSFRVTGWTKYYEDAGGHYPSWYKDGYPAVPAPGDSGRGWFDKDVMPKDANGKTEGSMRGAFGWYAMFLGPEAYGQWTHGTIGWGQDKDKYVARTKKPIVNLVSNPRSSGCTRVTNETIAYLRQMLPTGTPVIKIYAKEALLDSTLAAYTNQSPVNWKYALTKDKQLKADYEEVKASLKISEEDMNKFFALRNELLTSKDKKRKAEINTILSQKPFAQLLEIGEYNIDNKPDVIEYTPGEKMSKFGRKIGKKGNVYGMKTEEMQGTFYVDAGMLENYTHPTKLETGGFADEITPQWMDALKLPQATK